VTSDWAFDELHPDAYKMLVEGVAAILYIDRPDDASTNLYTSPQVEALLGFTVEEWRADPDLWLRQLHPDDRDVAVAEHRESNVRGERFVSEYRLFAKDGRIVWLRDEAVPVKNGDGTLLYWRGVMLDITERREAEEELARARERLQALIDNIPAAVYIETPDAGPGGFYLSSQVEKLFGYTVEEWTRTPNFWLDRIHPDDRHLVEERDAASDATRDRYTSEYRFRAADGRWVWVFDDAVFVPTAGGGGFWQGFLFDITERRETEDKLRWSLEVLRKTIQQRRELAQRLQTAQEAERRSIAADIHDDPIQVMSAVDMRLQMLAAFPETATTEDLVGIEADVKGAIERLRSLLFELRPTALDRDGLVPALRLYLEHTAKGTGWQVEVRDGLEEEPDPDLRALLYRIAQEGVSNARKHAHARRVEIDVATEGDGVGLRVSDDGKGFVADPAVPPEPGHFGLTTLVERAELAGGWSRVTSAPGEGTTVECWLPLDADADQALAGA
jgi:PAS domain S-box-containing protein